MNITSFNLKIIDKNLTIFAPENDQTWYGNLAGIRQREFPFEQTGEDGDILDIGCNIGLISIVCSVLYPDKNIYAYDACEWAIKCLEKTIKENGITNIFPYHKAVVANNNPFSSFSHETKGPSCFVQTSLTNQTDHPIDGYRVENIHVKSILEQVDKIAFLKMDIEGGEFELFDYLKNQNDYLDAIDLAHIEVHDLEGKDSESLVKYLWGIFPYSKKYISSHKYKPQ